MWIIILKSTSLHANYNMHIKIFPQKILQKENMQVMHTKHEHKEY